MASRIDIEFCASDGVVLRGWLFSAGQQRPCVIMTNGLSGLKSQFLDDFASHFQIAGYTTIVYDNRNWGSSDGQPRNETDPLLQTRDYFAAFDYAASLPDVDSTKIVYWGSSMAGGNVICAAALDKRVKAVIAQIPFVSGEQVSRDMGSEKAKFVLADRAKLATGGLSTMVPVVPDSREEAEDGTSSAILKTADVFPFLAELKRRGIETERSLTLQSLFYMQSHEPQTFIRRISPTPLLMVVGEHDLCVPTAIQLEMYQKALEPKRLHVVRGVGHFGVYYGAGFRDNIVVQLNFLGKVL